MRAGRPRSSKELASNPWAGVTSEKARSFDRAPDQGLPASLRGKPVQVTLQRFPSNRSGDMNFWRVAIDEETGKVLPEPDWPPDGKKLSGLFNTNDAAGRTGGAYRVGYFSFETQRY